MSRELYACLYVREFPTQALLRHHPDLRDRPCVVLEGDPPLQHVCSLNTRARLAAMQCGMTRVELGTFPECVTLERTKHEEVASQKALLAAAGVFSPRVEDRSTDRALVLGIDIAGTGKLFGPPAELAKKLLETVRIAGILARVVVSGNLDAAICTARGTPGGRRLLTIGRGHEAATLSPLPVTVLELTAQQENTFQAWGIHTLGALAALPERALIARIGQDARRLQQMARGEHPHLFRPVTAPLLLEDQEYLETSIELLDSLLFVVGVMLDRLILRAKERVLALAAVTITLSLDGGTTHVRTVKPAQSTLDRQFLLKLLHLDLEVHPPTKAITGVILKAEAGEPGRVQGCLFSPQLPDHAQLNVAMARIRKIVGDGNVGCAVLKDSHAPESFRIEPFQIPKGKSSAFVTPQLSAGLRMLRPPECVSVRLQDGMPSAVFFRNEHYTVGRAYGPWAGDGGWWNEDPWDVEQWDLVAHAQNGALLYGCMAHEPAQQQWRMVALYD